MHLLLAPPPRGDDAAGLGNTVESNTLEVDNRVCNATEDYEVRCRQDHTRTILYLVLISGFQNPFFLLLAVGWLVAGGQNRT